MDYNILFNQIKNAVNLLKDAPDKHNSSDKVKIYLMEDGLSTHILSKNWNIQDGQLICQFDYSRPEYEGSEEAMKNCDFDGTVAEWDWDNFTGGEDYYRYCERLLEEAKERIAIATLVAKWGK